MSQEQRGWLVSAPLITLQVRAPTLALKALQSSLVMAVVGLSELLSRPTTIAAPQSAPQVPFIEPIPAPNPEPRLSSCSLVSCRAVSISGANSKRTAWQQFNPSSCFTSTECSALSISVLFSNLLKIPTASCYTFTSASIFTEEWAVRHAVNH